MEIISLVLFLTLITTPAQGRQNDKRMRKIKYLPYTLLQDSQGATTKEDQYLLHKRRQLECVEETRVDADLVLKIKRGDWKRKPQHLVKKWVLCSLMKNNLMTAEGVYKIDIALSKVPKKDAERVETLIDKCLSTKAMPAEDIAYYYARCYHKNKGIHKIVAIV